MVIDEKNLVDELRNKNPDALNYLIDKYGPFIKAVVNKVVGVFNDRGMTEECISDVLMAVWTNIESFDDEKGTFKNWLGSVSKFKAIDYYRKQLKHQGNEIIDEKLSDGISAEDSYISNYEEEKLLSIIENLGEPDRTIFTMKFLLGCDIKRIGTVVGLSVSAVNTRVSRGRDKIRKAYYKKVGGGY